MTPRFARLWRALVRCACWLAVLVAFAHLCSYVIDARTRATRAPNCHWNDVPNPDSAIYSARWCKLTKDTVLLRLYDITAQHLLAERTYFHLDRPFVAFAPDKLIFNTYPEGSFITLPPTLFERLRAKLP